MSSKLPKLNINNIKKNNKTKSNKNLNSTKANLNSTKKKNTNSTKKNIKGKKRKFGFKNFTRVWAIVYLFALMVFEICLVIINVLPAKILLLTVVLLGLISIIVFTQLFFMKINKKSKIFATVLSSFLIILFSLGSVYSMGTNHFIDKLSEGKSKYAVNVTEKPFNIYITGLDFHGNIENEKGRSDVNMVVTVNPRNHRVLITSIPRDYEIKLVDHDNAKDKLTHTGMYGVDTGISSIENLLDIKVNYYLKLNFTTVKLLVDAIGGVDVNSEVEFDSRYWGDTTEYHHFDKGINHLNGELALCFARERKAFDGGDNQRIRNQQLVLDAVIEKMTSSRTLLGRYNKILSALGAYMRTNMSENEIKSLAKKQLEEMPKWTIEKYDLTGHDETKGTYTSGSQELYVMVPDEKSVKTANANIRTVMYDAFDEKAKEKIEGEITVIDHVMTPKEKAKANKKKK